MHFRAALRFVQNVPLTIEKFIEETQKASEVVLHQWQKNIYRAIIEGHDAVVSAGTGSGKSILFQAMSLLYPKGIVLVISPLKSLIDDQVRFHLGYI